MVSVDVKGRSQTIVQYHLAVASGLLDTVPVYRVSYVSRVPNIFFVVIKYFMFIDLPK